MVAQILLWLIGVWAIFSHVALSIQNLQFGRIDPVAWTNLLIAAAVAFGALALAP